MPPRVGTITESHTQVARDNGGEWERTTTSWEAVRPPTRPSGKDERHVEP